MKPAEEVVVSITQRIGPQGVFDTYNQIIRLDLTLNCFKKSLTFGTRFGIGEGEDSLGRYGTKAAHDREQGVQQHPINKKKLL